MKVEKKLIEKVARKIAKHMAKQSCFPDELSCFEKLDKFGKDEVEQFCLDEIKEFTKLAKQVIRISNKSFEEFKKKIKHRAKILRKEAKVKPHSESDMVREEIAFMLNEYIKEI